MTFRLLSILFLSTFFLLRHCSSAQCDELPSFKFTLKPKTMESTEFEIKGAVESRSSTMSFVIMPWHAFEFMRDGKTIEIKNGTELHFDKHDTANSVQFVGNSIMPKQKCEAANDEIYCMNNSIPNPEVLSDGSYYDVHFDLPKGFSALSSDSNVVQLNGFEFQIAKLSKPIVRHLAKTKLEFILPQGFHAKNEYLDYTRECLKEDLKQFGELPFSSIKIGAIQRGASSEINGNPSGNLILFSRTALGDSVNLSSPAKLGINGDLSDALRKLVIAHEFAHLWFGSKYLGQDGWMQEGIPQYIGLVSATKNVSEPNAAALILFFEKMAERGTSRPIPNSKFSEESPGYERDYYQAPLALYKLGKQLGQDKVISFLISVYAEKRDPSFDDFNRKFAIAYPGEVSLWRKLWNLDP